MVTPVVLYQHHHFLVATFGGRTCSSQRDLTDAAMTWCKKRTGHDMAHLIYPPRDASHTGFQTVLHAAREFKVRAEGMLVQPQSGIGILSKDCAIAVAYNHDSGALAAAHTGRAALSPPVDCAACSFTVMQPLLSRVATTGHTNAVEIYVTASICGHCFQHEQPGAQGLIVPFRARYPQAIVGDFGLDQFTVIKGECTARGVDPSRITHDSVCTKAHPQLSSHRNQDEVSNLTLIVRLR